MKDTSEEVEELMHRRYMEMTGEERLLAGARMFESARTMVLASAPEGLNEDEVRRFLCFRFYGEDREKNFVAGR